MNPLFRCCGVSGAAMVVFALAFASTPPGFGQDSMPLGSNDIPLLRSQFERWKDRSSQIEAQVRSGNFKKAESTANGLLRDLKNKLTGGPDACRIIAMPLSLRALAPAGAPLDRPAPPLNLDNPRGPLGIQRRARLNLLGRGDTHIGERQWLLGRLWWCLHVPKCTPMGRLLYIWQLRSSLPRPTRHVYLEVNSAPPRLEPDPVWLP